MTHLAALLARTDADAHGWLADRLLAREEVVVEDAPPAGLRTREVALEAAG